MNNYYVYIVKCSDNTLYTGYTTDLDNRIKVHNEGKGAKYTRARLPVKYVFTHQCKDLSHALKLEYKIKRLNRNKKIDLINHPKKIENLEEIIKDIEI